MTSATVVELPVPNGRPSQRQDLSADVIVQSGGEPIDIDEVDLATEGPLGPSFVYGR